jgi:DNA repair protein RecO (recombination protein O)
MKLFSSEAIILRHLDYGEADRVVTFYTPGHGRLRGFARSARKSRKRFGAALEPFSHVRMHWTPSPSGDLVRLKEAELLDLRAGLRQDLTAIALAGYGCELVEELLAEEQGHGDAFSLLQAFLDHLAEGGATPETRLLFELRLLVLAGYAPHLLHCSECGGPLGDLTAAFDAARGGALCLACASSGTALRISPLTLGSLSRTLRGPMTLFAGFRFSIRTQEEGRGILTGALRQHLPRPLKSLSFLDRMDAGLDGR